MSNHPHNLLKAAYSIDEVVELLSLGRNLVFDLLNAGELRRVKIGRRTIVTTESLVAFLDRKSGENAQAQPYGMALIRKRAAELRQYEAEAAANAMEA
jgi:hypothetical protein